MKHLILGTAGHIDHGKTSLVKALTGIDTDRLKEEKARGITIELGFAHLELSDGICFGIVDVPGHERFVRTMVAGVGGMDLVMLVIAADEGIMPQTREHLDILRLLGVRHGLVALTKSDLVEQEWLELVTEEVREFVAGSFLAEAPIVPVSARSGAGLDALRSVLADLAAQTREKRPEGPYRLPVDRVFTVAGFGTVVTGTLLAGEVRMGDEVELLPTGIRGRVRGIQAHGRSAERGTAGQRLAVNLQGIDHDQARRGDVVVPLGAFHTTRAVDVRLDLLPSAPRDLRHRSTLRLHSATYEVPAQVILLDRDTLTPGESAYAQLRLKSPALLLPGDSYILRCSSPATTIGGGVVLDPLPPRRRRRSDEALKLLESIGGEDQQATIGLLIGQSLLSGIDFDELLLRSGIPRKQAEAALAALLATGAAVQACRDPRFFLSREAFGALKQALLDELHGFMAANPLREGMGREQLRTRLPRRSDPRFFTPLMTALEKDGVLIADRELVKPSATSRAAAGGLAGPLLDAIAAGGSEPPTVRELTERFHCDEKGVREHLAPLVRSGRLARVSGDLYYAAEALDGLREQLVALLTEKGEIAATDFRERCGLSRKFLIPVLEHFDSEKVTIRVGDKRVLRRK